MRSDNGPPGARVLVVEDDVELVCALRTYLVEAGFEVVAVGDGEEAFGLLLEVERFDAVVLDVLLPGLDGREVCQRLRGAGCSVPIVMVTALGEVEDRITGLSRGADDYLVKPFSLEELSLRLRAVVRRGESGPEAVLQLGDLRVDLLTHQAWRGDTKLKLTEREFKLLELFLRRPGLVLSRDSIWSTVWGATEKVSENLIDQHIAHLRKKVDRPFGRNDIETLTRVGYRMRAS